MTLIIAQLCRINYLWKTVKPAPTRNPIFIQQTPSQYPQCAGHAVSKMHRMSGLSGTPGLSLALVSSRETDPGPMGPLLGTRLPGISGHREGWAAASAAPPLPARGLSAPQHSAFVSLQPSWAEGASQAASKLSRGDLSTKQESGQRHGCVPGRPPIKGPFMGCCVTHILCSVFYGLCRCRSSAWPAGCLASVFTLQRALGMVCSLHSVPAALASEDTEVHGQLRPQTLPGGRVATPQW